MNSKRHQAGFTVLELMVATSVFAVVLMVLTAGVLAFSRDYFKSIAENNAQATARGIINDIAQNLQFGSNFSTMNSPTASVDGFCIDQTAYSYSVGYQVVPSPSASDQRRHGLVKSVNGNCTGSTALDLSNSSLTLNNKQQELLGDHMRLGILSVDELGGGSYRIHVKVIYGDSDLLTNPDDGDWSNVGCISGSGSQFCAVSDLSTVVQARLAGK